MNLTVNSQSAMQPQDGGTQVSVPRFNSFDVYVVEQGRPLMKKGGGVITFRNGATELTLFGFNDQIPEIGAIVKIWGVSLEHGPFLLPTAQCHSHGEGVLKGSATFVQVIAPSLEAFSIPQFNAEANMASEYGRLLLKDNGAVIVSNLGATQITVFGFKQNNLPNIGSAVKIWGVSNDHGPYFLPNARCISHGEGVLKGSATFVQPIIPRMEDVGIQRANAFDINVTLDGQPLLMNETGLITFRFGGTELIAFGFEKGKYPDVGSIVSIWGVSLERGPFFLQSAKCTSHGTGLLENSATFVQMIVGPTSK